MSDNKYIDALNGLPEDPEEERGQAKNKYLDALNGVDSRVSGSVYAGTQKNPELSARAARIARDLSLPSSIVSESVDRFVLDKKRKDMRDFVMRNPETVDLFGNPDFVARTHDDIDTAEGLSRALKEKGFKRLSAEKRQKQNVDAVMERYGNLSVAAAQEVSNATGADYEQALPFGNRYASYALAAEHAGDKPANVREWYTELTGKPFEPATLLDEVKQGWYQMRAGQLISQADTSLRQMNDATAFRKNRGGTEPDVKEIAYRKEADRRVQAALVALKEAGALPESFQMERLSDAEGFLDGLKQIVDNPKLMLDVIASSAAPTTLIAASGGAGGIGTRLTGLKAIKYLGLGGGSFDVNRTSRTLEALSQHGVDVTNAESLFAALQDDKLMAVVRGEAARYAAGVSLLDTFSLAAADTKLAPRVGIAARAIGGRYAEGVVDLLSQIGVQAGLGGSSEIVGEYAATGRRADAGEVLAEAVGEIATLPGDIAANLFAVEIGEAAEQAAHARRVSEAIAADHNLNTLEALSDLTTNSKTMLRDDSESYSQLLQAMAGEAGVDEVFMPARDAVAAVGGSQAVEQMFPSLAGKVDGAAALGEKLPIPISEFILGVHRNQQFAEVLRGMVSVDVNGMSAAEAHAFLVTQQDELQQRMEKVAQEAANASIMREDIDNVRMAVDDELKRTNMFTGRARSFYTDLRTAFYATMAQRAGMSPSELYARHPLRLAVSEGARTQDTYDQSGKLVTDTPEFKRWFGDSKVVDAEGKPLVVYHGTASDVAEFSDDFAKGERALFFTDDRIEAGSFASRSARGRGGENVMPVYLSMTNPLIVDMAGRSDASFDRLIAQAKHAGHDGVIARNANDTAYPQPFAYNDVYIAFRPEQIKSVNNRGTFDTNDANILNQEGFKDEEGYFFAQEAAVAQRARLEGAGEEAGELTDDRLREALRSTPYGWRKGDVGSARVATWRLAPTIRQALEARGISTPDIIETTDADAFRAAVVKAHSAPYGAAVYAYSEEEYKGMRLFVVGDGAAGFALKGDDLVSLFKNDKSLKGVVDFMLPLAIQLGARRLDAFDTVLPKLYSDHGFKAVARVKWNDDYAPGGWSKKEFSDFNKGQPDVVYMSYDPNYGHGYERTDGPYVSTPEEAKALQDEALVIAGTAPQRLANADYAVDVDGRTIEFGMFPRAMQAAREYMLEAGLPYNPPSVYVRVNEDRARAIAAAYEAMPHAPNDPEVRASYEQLAKETIAQYRKILETGLKVEFVPSGQPDPYGNPRNVILDVVNNNHMWVFSTRDGFGSNEAFDPTGNPLLAETEFEISGQKALVNDLFRVVHDYFGHVMDGVGFRASGEENAWRAHWAMFSPLARRAMTTETRGQNSWLNFGPQGEKNRTAKTEDTTFADQKTGLLPDWVVNEGATDEQVKGSVEYNQAIAPPFYSALTEGVGSLKAKALTADGWKAELKGLVSKGVAKQAEIDAVGVIDWLDAQSIEVDGKQQKIDKEAVERFITANGITIEETVYGGEAEDEIAGVDFPYIQWQTEEPDYSYLQETGDDAYFDEILEEKKQDKADELEIGVDDLDADIVAELEEEAHKKAFEKARDDYYNDSESPQFARVDVELPNGDTEEFHFELAYGEARVYWPRKQDYIMEGNWRNSEAEMKQAVVEHLYEYGLLDSGRSADALGVDGPAVYEQYSSRKGRREEYRELLLSLPSRAKMEGGNFTAPHFGDNDPPDNIVAHVRFTVRPDIDGNDTLFIEEIQSDWAQAGREEGFAEDVGAMNSELIALYDELSDVRGEMEVVDPGRRSELANKRRELEDKINKLEEAKKANYGKAPVGPFVKSTDAWVTLVLKRVVRWAAENGYEQVAIIGGQESADRYSLTNHVDTLELRARTPEEMATLSRSGMARVPKYQFFGKKSGGNVIVRNLDTEDELRELIGKDMANKLLAADISEREHARGTYSARILEGEDLKFGGEGMLFFYGDESGAGVGKKPDGTPSVVAKNLTKLLKQLGGEPPIVIRLDEERANAYFIRQRENGEFEAQAGFETKIFPTWSEANTWLRNSDFMYGRYLGFTINEKMRDLAINKGLPLFQGADRRGSYSPETGIIKLSRASDLSTFLHESGHQFLDIMFDLASRQGAAADVVDDMNAILKWFGVASMEEWASMNLEQRRPYHEKWAEGFEEYLTAGRAPSHRLRAAFRAFGQWLRRIYGKLRNEVPQEIRDVMDRMLASEKEIDDARKDTARPLFSSASEAGMTDEQWLAYKADDAERMDEAHDTHQRRRLRDLKWLSNAKSRMLKKLQKQALAVRKGVRIEIADEVAGEQVYRAMEFVRHGKVVDENGVETEVPHKLNIGALTDMYAGTTLGSFGLDPAKWEALGRGKNGLLAADGLHPDVVASMFGYPSGDEMIRAMLDAEDFNVKVDALTDRRMLEEHADLADEQAIEQSAIEALHGDAHLKFLATEQAALANVVGSRKMLLSTVKEVADTIIRRTPIKDIKPYIYVEAERRAGRNAEKAMRVGDLEAAAEEKRNQLINAALTKMAYEATATIDKRVAAMRNIFGNDKKLAKYRDMNMVNTARALVSAHEVSGNIDNPLAYLEKVKAYDPESYALLSQIITPLLSQIKPFTRMSLDDFIGFSDIVAQLWHLSRRTKQIEVDGKLIDRAEIISELREKIAGHEKGGKRAGLDSDMREIDKMRVTFQSWGSTLRRVESWVTKMDGGPRGPFRKYLWNPVRYSVEHYRTRGGYFMNKYRMLIKNVDMGNGSAIAAPEIGYTFTKGKASVLHALLHTGNESNKRKLLLGRGWGVQDEMGNLDSTKFDSFIERLIREGTLTKDDFDFAQGVWDLMEEMKPDAQKAHKAVYGYYFDEITAKPFSNAYGDYRGGYVPAVTDSFLVADAAVNEGAENLVGEGSFMWPSTGAGFTKARVEYNKQLALDLRLVMSHIDKAARFSYIQPAIQDVARMLRQPSLRSAMEKIDITVIPDMLLPWLQRSASQSTTVPSDSKFGRASDRFFRWSRSTAGLSIMFANVVNTLQQFTGLSIAALRANKTSLAISLVHLTRNPIDTHRFIRAKSEFMANRNTTMMMDASQDIKKILDDKNIASRAVDFTRTHGYFMQTFTQSVVDNIVWLAAYRDATKMSDMTDPEAVRIADAAVRETQGSFSPEDVSRIETGSAFYQMFMMFAGYFNMQANVLATDFSKAVKASGIKDKYGRLLYVYIFGFMIPAVVAEAIVQGFQPDDGDDDDEDNTFADELLEVFFMPQLRTATAMVPGVGMAASSVVNRLDGKWYNDRLTMSPVASVGERAAHGASVVMTGELFDDELKKSEIKDTMMLLSVMTGSPVFAASGKPLGYAAEVEAGDAEPSGPVDAVRGMVTGR